MGCILALAIGALIVVVFYGALLAFLGAPRPIPTDEWPFLLFQILFAAAPFGFLALVGIKSTAPWLAAAVLTILFWAAFFVSVLISARDGTGANIGMGLVMFVSPLVIGGGAWLVSHLTTDRA